MGQGASSGRMDLSRRNPEEDAEHTGETHKTPAASCPTCRLAVRVAVSLAAVILVTGLVLTLALLTMRTAAAETDQTANSSGQELRKHLQQCQEDCRDLNLVLHTVTRDSRCGVCPERWFWWNGHCYFFSVGLEENLQWDESAEFCQRHNSSLAVITDRSEMEFIQGVMRTFPYFPFLWVGLTDSKEEGRWLWRDGAEIQHYMPAKVEWDGEDRDCADLRGGGSLFAADCEAYGPWACKRES
ncbi:natural killer cells antigen CD94-like [Centroberyx gerrardi]